MATPALSGTSSNGRSSGSVASLTFAHTANGDPLVVCVSTYNNSTDIATVTFNGVALKCGGRSLAHGLSWWYLVAPGSVTANLVITPVTAYWLSAAGHNLANLGGVADLSVLVTTTFALGSTAVAQVSAASSVSAFVLDMVSSHNINQTWTPGASQTKIYSQDDATQNAKTAMSWRAGGAGAVTCSWTLAGADAWRQMALSFADPASAMAGEVVSQLTAEVLSLGARTTQISQLTAEVISSGARSTVISQLAAEVITPGRQTTQYSQLTAEVLTPGSQTHRVAQLVAEVLSGGTARTQYSQLVVEVIKDATILVTAPSEQLQPKDTLPLAVLAVPTTLLVPDLGETAHVTESAGQRLNPLATLRTETVRVSDAVPIPVATQRVSQLAAEVAVSTSEQRVSQLVVELPVATAGQRVSALAVEVASPGTAQQRVSALAVEVASPGVVEQRVSQLVVEVARRDLPETTFPPLIYTIGLTWVEFALEQG